MPMPQSAQQVQKPARDEKQFLAVRDFCEALLKEYRPLIKTIWLLPPESEGSGSVLIVLFDDTKKLDHITVGKVRLAAIEQERRAAGKYNIDLHTSFYLLSDYWEFLKHGSPTTFCEIREGVPLYDPSGFFVPLKKLLLQGKIPGTKEAIHELISRAPTRVRQIERNYKAKILEHFFNAMVEAGQAPLILAGVAPPIPKKVPDALDTHFAKKGLLGDEYVKYARELVACWKAYEHGEARIHWAEIDDLGEKTSRFIQRMQRLMGEVSKQ
ncbi:MAG: hypothetical protein ACP5E4_02415 [Candidatus Aenigmatarchaeota archaeon]